MTDKGLYSCTFTAKVIGIPELQYEKYVESRAVASGVRGYIEPVGDDLYVGKLEGTKFAIDFMKDVLVNPTEYYDELQDITFSKLSELNIFSLHSFHIKNDCLENDGFVPFDFCTMAYDMMEQNANRVEQVKEVINLKAKNAYEAMQQKRELVEQNLQSALETTINKVRNVKQQAACYLYNIALRVTMAISKYCGTSARPQRQGVQTQTVNFQSQAPY